jgi:hypothetical protein
VSSGLLRRVALVRTDVSEEPGASFIRVTKIGELGTTQAVTNNRRTLQSFVPSHWFLSPWWRRRWVPPKRRFLQEPHGVTSQKTRFCIVSAVKTSRLTWYFPLYLFGGVFTLNTVPLLKVSVAFHKSFQANFWILLTLDHALFPKRLHFINGVEFTHWKCDEIIHKIK